MPQISTDLFLLAAIAVILAAIALAPRLLKGRMPLRFDRHWLRRNYWLVMIGAGLILGLFAIIFYLAEAALIVSNLIDRLRVLSAAPGDNSEAIRNIGQTTALLLGALAAAATLIFQLVKVWVTERQTLTAEQGHITDRINEAVRNLGADKVVNRLGRTVRYTTDGADHSYFEWQGQERPAPPHDTVNGKAKLTNDPWSSFPDTQPNLEVRVGAIYALERIAKDSHRDHIQIMEILCAYIRQNAPVPTEEDNPHHVFWGLVNPEDDRPSMSKEEAWETAAFQKVKTYGSDPSDMTIRNMVDLWAKHLSPPRIDIQIALTVIGRRPSDQIALERNPGGTPRYCLDLRSSNLRGADIQGLRLEHAVLLGTRLEGAKLIGAYLNGANLFEARLEGAVLWQANLQVTNLFEARLEGATLVEAWLIGANLFDARLEGANLWKAQLEGATLVGARLNGANLGKSRLEGANLHGARLNSETSFDPATLQGAGLKNVNLESISSDRLPEAYGDASVALAAGLEAGHGPLAHWCSKDLGYPDFLKAWRAWQAEHHPDLLPDDYKPDQPPPPASPPTPLPSPPASPG